MRRMTLLAGCGLLYLLLAGRDARAQTPEPPEAPESVAVYSITDQMLEVRWSSSDFAATTGYKVQWKSGDEEYDPARQVWVDPKWYTGCTTEPLRYCPSKAVTRAQMATFLTRALDLAQP